MKKKEGLAERVNQNIYARTSNHEIKWARLTREAIDRGHIVLFKTPTMGKNRKMLNSIIASLPEGSINEISLSNLNRVITLEGYSAFHSFTDELLSLTKVFYPLYEWFGLQASLEDGKKDFPNKFLETLDIVDDLAKEAIGRIEVMKVNGRDDRAYIEKVRTALAKDIKALVATMYNTF